MLENVPRITSRGADLLRQVKRLLGAHGYLFHEGFHDCGEIGGLGQHRKRYLLIARLPEKMTSFIYKPPQRRVKSIGEIIGPLPFPDDPEMGPMHRLPRLKWLTWVRLALIPAGGDWRDLEKIAPDQYRLEYVPRGAGSYGVQEWDKPASTVVGSAYIKGSNPVAVADPRLSPSIGQSYKGSAGLMGVLDWNKPAKAVTGRAAATSSNCPATVADPRLPRRDNRHPAVYQVVKWDEPGPCVTGTRFGSGAPAVADPRMGCRPRGNTKGPLGVQAWEEAASTVFGAMDVHSGPAAVADHRIPADNDRPDPPPVIIALDGTWHRPLTTLELAALQGFPVVLEDGSLLVLAGKSDARWRERIGNAVPPPAARAIAEQILTALLVSETDGWALGATGVWVRELEEEEICLVHQQ
jgi:site-specific DNA-cytosine methylase